MRQSIEVTVVARGARAGRSGGRETPQEEIGMVFLGCVPTPGNGDAAFFFGFTSARPSRFGTAHVEDTLGSKLDLEARVPEP